MKKLSQLFAVTLIVLLGISTSFAGTKTEIAETDNDFKVAFLNQNIDQMIVSFEAKGDPVQINVLDNSGKRVHTEAISGRGVFAKRYDLSELDKGIYSFQVDNGIKAVTKTVILK